MGPVRFSGSAREGPERCGQRPSGFQGGPRESGSGPRGAFLQGPGSAKVRQGFNFEVNPGLVLTFSFFALNDFGEVPRGSPERGAEQTQFQKGAEGGESNSLWGSEGGPGPSGNNVEAPKRPRRGPEPAENGGRGPLEEQESKILKL